jgi:hypothetical protein
LNFSLLDHPLDSKSLRSLSSAGVYIFLAEPREKAEAKLGAGGGILFALSEGLEVLYVGKAKELRQRLQNYRRGGSGSAGEWQKSAKLNEAAKSVLIIPTPTHFEACLLELFLIRILVPQLNYTSTDAGRIYFVLQDRLSRRLSVSSRKKTGMKVWGVVRARRQVRAAFDALTESLDNYQEASGEIAFQPFYSRFGRSSGGGRLIVDVAAQSSELCSNFLRGRRSGIVDAVWKAMKKAAESQQFHVAAQMRDRYLVLHELQSQLRRSRRLIRGFRNVRIDIPASGSVPARTFVVRRFQVCGFEMKTAENFLQNESPFSEIFRDAVEHFRREFSDCGEIESLRVNFEFLRLMLWWHGNRSEREQTDSGS